MFRLAVVLLLLVALPARANLGESVADCVKRYGKPVGFTEAGAQNPFGTMVFVAGPYQLLIFLSNTVEVGARVTKKDKTAFTPDEMKTIMDADASTPWVTTTSTDPTCQEWTRADKATVLYDTDKNMLIFTSPRMAEALRSKPPVPASAPDTNAAPETPAMPKTPGSFAPAPPTLWALPSAPSTNAPAAATNAP